MGRIRRIALVASLMLVLAGCDWAQLGFGPGHTNADPVDAPLSVAAGAHLTTAWSAACSCGPPIAAGGLVYVADFQGGVTPRDVILRALDASSGAQRWSVALNRIGHAEFLAVGNGVEQPDRARRNRDRHALRQRLALHRQLRAAPDDRRGGVERAR
jgi:hypothetical protein